MLFTNLYEYDVPVYEDGYERLKEDVLEYQQKGRVVLLGDFNARVSKSTDVDDVIGIFGEDTCNRSGNNLISFLNELELVICNGRQCVSEPEWTRVRPSLDQKSVIDYIITDAQLLRESGDVCIDSTDIGMSDHFLVCWVEQQRILGNRSVQLEGGVLISLVMMLLEKSIVKYYRQRLRPFQRGLIRWRKEE